MPLKNLGCFILLCFLFIPAMAQSSVPADSLHIDFGYGTQRTSDVTAVIDSLKAKNFNHGAIFNPAGQLAGKIAGLTITQPGGDPNQTASISIRGQTSLFGNLSPLFVVDGVILDDAAQFQNIPPGDIASYDFLKDASATALYGSRGANGVIIVTTKKGIPGRTTITYDGLVGSAVQSKYYDLLTPDQYRAAIGSGNSSVDKGGNTDWQKAISRTAVQQSHSVAVSKAGNTFNYIASASYQNQQGIILNNGKEQLGLRFNGEQKAIQGKLDLNAGIQYVNTTRKFTNYSTFSYMYNAPPTYPVTNPDGSYYTFSDFNEANPVEHLNQEVLGDKEYLTVIHASADYAITHDLKVGIFGSSYDNKIQSAGFIPTFPLEGNPSQQAQGNENNYSYKGNIHLNYGKTFGKSRLNLLAGYEYNHYFYNDNYLTSSSSGGSSSSSFKQEYKLMSFFARAAFNYDDRVYATAILRRDAALSDQQDYFPSLSLAYRLKKDLFAGAEWISDIKLRAGYGVAGNSVNQSINPPLGSEKRYGRDAGLDFALFKGRLSGEVSYFNDETKNLLVTFPTPTPPFITSTLITNGGSLTNKGFELALSGQVISEQKLNWTLAGQITFITTTINDLSGQYNYGGQTYQLNANQTAAGYVAGRGLSSNPIAFLKTGNSPFIFYLPHYTGVDAQGNQTFDGKTIAQVSNPAGHYIDPTPKFNYGVTNSVDYCNWNFNFALRGVVGQKIFNNTLLDVETVTRLPGNNVTTEALTNRIKDAPIASDKWLEDASFLRMDNATLSYTFKNLSFSSSLRVFVSSNNLFVITKYRGLDPEIKTENTSGGSSLFGLNLNGRANQPYIDANYGGQAYYPMARTLSVGVNVSLK